MIVYSSASLHQTAVHFVGNPSNDDPLTLSESLLDIHEDDQEPILNYLMRAFKPEAFYHFTTNGNLVYDAVKELFDEKGNFLEASQTIASHLYDVSTHPRILAGDLFVARIREVSLHNEYADCIVLLKAEVEDKFAQVEWADKHSNVQLTNGYRLDRIDKACLIFSLEPGDGYRVLIVDKTNGNSAEAQYWTDAFLELETLEDSYHFTQQYMQLTKDFVKEELPENFEVNPAEQIALLNRSSKFFKEKQQFDFDNFAEEVMQQPEVVSAFRKFTETYSEDPEHSITEQFDINAAAVKKHAGMFKSVLKLDKNFHIYVHGNRQLIERGYDDEKGMNYYKVFFSNEQTT
ncbi:MAG: hypothetical protein RLZZ543_2137 [Bacteroidota bacterium]|jgi:hypothetical protein